MPAEPATIRYRMTEGVPRVLDFKGVRVKVSVRGDLENCWMLYATKESDPGSCLEIMRRPSMYEWAQARIEGFEVPAGSAADRIMQRLVREGSAVAMQPGESYVRLRKPKMAPYH